MSTSKQNELTVANFFQKSNSISSANKENGNMQQKSPYVSNNNPTKKLFADVTTKVNRQSDSLQNISSSSSLGLSATKTPAVNSTVKKKHPDQIDRIQFASNFTKDQQIEFSKSFEIDGDDDNEDVQDKNKSATPEIRLIAPIVEVVQSASAQPNINLMTSVATIVVNLPTCNTNLTPATSVNNTNLASATSVSSTHLAPAPSTNNTIVGLPLTITNSTLTLATTAEGDDWYMRYAYQIIYIFFAQIMQILDIGLDMKILVTKKKMILWPYIILAAESITDWMLQHPTTGLV